MYAIGLNLILNIKQGGTFPQKGSPPINTHITFIWSLALLILHLLITAYEYKVKYVMFIVKAQNDSLESISPLEAVGKKNYLILGNIEKSAICMTCFFCSVIKLYSAFAFLYSGNKGNMTCHNSKVTLDTSDGQLYCLSLKNIAVRGGNCQSECVHTSIPLAFSTASSIVPTNRNADSGRSSCLPSIISLKPLIVSESGT